MTAAGAFQNQKILPSSGQETRPREPSMEDILASIRRIIADDQVQAGRSGVGSLRRGSQPAPSSLPSPEITPALAAQPVQQQAPLEDVLDLAKMPDTAVSEPFHHEAPEPFDFDPQPAVSNEPSVSEPEVAVMTTPAPGSRYAAAMASLTRQSAEADRHTAPMPNYADPRHIEDQQPAQSAADGGEALISPLMGASVMSAFETLAATVVLQNEDMLDRVMHELMRPLLKTWLDENLPTLVERLVRTEIERVARGNRR